MTELETSARPYRDEFAPQARLPSEGRDHAAILAEMEALCEREAPRSAERPRVGRGLPRGRGAYCLSEPGVCPQLAGKSAARRHLAECRQYEAEIVAMTAHMFGAGVRPASPAPAPAGERRVCGTVTSGGTESILLAMKTYRDRAGPKAASRGRKSSLPVTAHAAFDKAAEYFGMRLVSIPVDDNYLADVAAARRAIGRNTVVVVGSAPSLSSRRHRSHRGVWPGWPANAELAFTRMHAWGASCCPGPSAWATRCRPSIFVCPGVTSMSVERTSTVTRPRGPRWCSTAGTALRRYQYFAAADWPGGLYCSPTLGGQPPRCVERRVLGGAGGRWARADT